MVRRTLVGLAALTIVCLVSDVTAHTRLTSPTPRSDSDGLKSGPCGNVTRTTSPMSVAPGESITVTWLETVDHPGYYRIALSPDSDDGFDDNVLADDITDVDCPSTPCSYTQEVTIPANPPCTDCTLQLIQFMGTAAPYSPYFSCADLEITGVGSPDAGPDNMGDGDVDGGCQVSGASSRGGLLTLLLVCLVLGWSGRHRTRS